MQHTITIDGQQRDIDIRPMDEDLILWRCLHGGPLSEDNIGRWPDPPPDWPAYRATNLPLLTKLIRTYGTCAILAWDGNEAVGFLRFYPKVISALADAGGLCMQGPFPSGPSERLVDAEFPPLGQISDKTLAVHCLMTGSPFHDSPYQRKGVGAAMARYLIQWATEHGWQAIEANGYEELDVLYQNTGSAGRDFWKKLGFHVIETATEHALQGKGEFFDTLRRQAIEQGLSADSAANKYTLRLALA